MKKPRTHQEHIMERAHSSLCGRCIHAPLCRMAEAIRGAERVAGQQLTELFVVTVSQCYQFNAEPGQEDEEEEEVIR